jgi:hypothetical protein
LNLRKLKRGRKGSRLAVSEIMGAVIMLAVTLGVGFAAWAWAQSASNTAEKSFGASIQSNVNCLNQNFVITNANFSSTNNKIVTAWFFNSGNGTITISITTISNSTWSYQSTSAFQVAQGKISPVTFNVNTNFKSGSLYTFNSVARCQGDIVSTYQQVR